MKRIKYKYVNSTLMSKDSFLCGDVYLYIVLTRTFDNEESFQYAIREWSTTQVRCYGTAKTLTLIKKCAKMKLIELGAVFHEEIRNKEIIG